MKKKKEKGKIVNWNSHGGHSTALPLSSSFVCNGVKTSHSAATTTPHTPFFLFFSLSSDKLHRNWKRGLNSNKQMMIFWILHMEREVGMRRNTIQFSRKAMHHLWLLTCHHSSFLSGNYSSIFFSLCISPFFFHFFLEFWYLLWECVRSCRCNGGGLIIYCCFLRILMHFEFCYYFFSFGFICFVEKVSRWMEMEYTKE